MMSLLLAALVGCSGSPSAPSGPLADGAMPALDLPRGAATTARPLHVATDGARYELADSNLPEVFDAESRAVFDLGDFPKRRPHLPLPFRLDDAARDRLADDLVVRVDGRPFKYSPLGGGTNTWSVSGNEVVLRTTPKDRKAVLHYGGASRLVDRRSLSRSGLPAARFVEESVTIDGTTVPGLFLTSPSKVTWSIEVPATEPRFAAVPSLMPPVVPDAASDGLKLELWVRTEGDAELVGSTEVKEVAFGSWEADLARWAGKTVDLELRTVVEGTPDHDYAFVGTPTVWGRPDRPVRRVLVLGLDTTRPRSIGWYGYDRPTTPELDRFANQSIVAVDAWTPAPRTRPSFRSSTTGRYPLEAIGATNIGEVFQQNGFATAGFVANIHLQPRFDFDEGFDIWRFDGRANADDQVDRALSWFRDHEDRDTYMFLHFMDPHMRYAAPGAYRDMFVEKHDPNLPRGFSRWQVTRWLADGELTDLRRNHIIGLYDGEMRFMSEQIGRLVDALDAMDGETLIVLHNDHGEELFEHGGFEHNHTLYDDVTRAVLWVRPPGGTKGGPVRIDQHATLADIAPTLYDLVGFDDTPPTDGISLLPHANGAAATRRPIGIGHLRFGLDRYAVVVKGFKYIVMTGSGAEELYDLTSDPLEQNDLAASRDLGPWRKALVEAHPGLRAGMGFRLEIQGQVPDFALDFGAPVTSGVLDPGYTSMNRPNLAWGQAPGPGPETVGRVAVEGTRMTFESASRSGQLWVLGAEASLPTAIEVDGETTALAKGEHGLTYRATTGGSVTIRPSMVLVPPPDEADRMRKIGDGVDSASDDETCRLCELGYIEGPACEGC